MKSQGEPCDRKGQARFEVEGSGVIQTFTLHSLKTDYIWVTDLETYEDAQKLMKYAFTDYNTVRPHSSISYLSPVEFERRWAEDKGFRTEFIEKRNRKEERRLKYKMEKERRLKENVSYDEGISVQN